MNLRLSEMGGLESGELVLAKRLENRENPNRWAMVICHEDRKGLLFLPGQEGEIDHILFGYQPKLLATGLRLTIEIDPTNISLGRQDLPDTDSPGSKLCALTSGTYLFVAECARGEDYFDRSFFVDIAGKAIEIDEIQGRRDGVVKFPNYHWYPSEKSELKFREPFVR